MAYQAGYLFGGLIGVAVVSLLGALLLMLALYWVAKKEVSYGEACGTMFLALVATLMVRFGIEFLLGKIAPLFLSLLGFLVFSAIISAKIRISFGRAILVVSAMHVPAVVIGGSVLVFLWLRG
ncbi:MAG TPA: hypothetical protein PKH31_09960 [Candidatus Sumerlaeota bacterium]|nr:hypothetical protein [Candidatus Sumerlaeota bacterium]